MSRKRWVRLDNASNIFLAGRSSIDTKVFRLTAELKEVIKPEVLQQALDATYDQYVLYHSVLRRGVFWYYLEESDLRPKVLPETKTPCTQIYHYDRRELLFRVMYRYNRVHLEVFHALSDGTGALWFFQDLLTEYLFLLHAKEQIEKTTQDETSSDRMEEQLENSFFRYFKQTRQPDFAKAAESALSTVKEETKEEIEEEEVPDYSLKAFGKPVYHVKGEKTPDHRTHVMELTMPVKQVLDLAHANNASLTIYLSALFMEAVKKTAPQEEQSEKIRLSLPVNLRQVFPSRSARNFFTAIYLSYRFPSEKDTTIKEVCRSLQNQLKSNLEKEQLQKRLHKLISFELHPLIRGVIRPVKDWALKLVNMLNNRQITIALSNLGKVTIPEPFDSYIQALYFHTSAVRPQCSVISFEDWLTVSFSSPFIETEIQEQFVRLLTEKGVDITVSANKVVYEEIEGVFK